MALSKLYRYGDIYISILLLQSVIWGWVPYRDKTKCIKSLTPWHSLLSIQLTKEDILKTRICDLGLVLQ